MSELQPTPHTREQVSDALARFQTVWTDQRPSQTVVIDGASIAASTRPQREDNLTSPIRTAVFDAFAHVLSFTGFTPGCRSYLFEVVDTSYEFGFPYYGVQRLLTLDLPEDDLGPFDPTKAHDYEKVILGEYIERIAKLSNPDFKKKKIEQVRSWEADYRQQYADDSFAEPVAEL